MTATDGVAAPGPGASGSRIDQLRDAIPEPARDIRLNLQSVLAPGTLTPEHRWGVAVASAVASRNRQVQEAVIGDARGEVSAAVIDDAVAAATLMAMNNVYYRFRHLVEKPSYLEKPARLRMNRLAKPATTKLAFELYSLAASAIGGCGTCMQAHERVVVEGGLTEDQVHEAIRIAATINGAAVALEVLPLG
jgi:alkyl hydroperoxide reductase subunit D